MSLSGVRITCTPQSPSWGRWLACRQNASHLVTRTFPVQLLKTQTSFLWAVLLRCPSWLSELNFTFSIVLSVTKRVGLPPSKRGSEKPASDLVFSSQLCTSNRLQSYELRALVLFTRTHMVTCVKWQHSLCHDDRNLPMGYRCKPVCFRIPGMFPPPMTAISGRGKGSPHEWQVTLEWGDVCLATKLSSGCTIFLILPFLFFSFPSFPVLVSETTVCLTTPILTPDNPTPPPGSSTWNCPVVLLFHPWISFSFIAEKIMHVIKI